MSHDSPDPDDAFARQLIRSASADRSPRGARTRALGALGLGSGLTASATSKAAAMVANNGAASAGAKVGGTLATKWLAVVILGGLATTGVVAVKATARPTPALVSTGPTRGPALRATAMPGTSLPSAPSVQGDPASPSPSSAPASPPAATVPVPAPPSTESHAAAAKTAIAPPPVDHTPTVADQARSLDEARVAIAAGNGPRGLSLLDEFGRRFPRSPLGEEALVLRIEALAASGDRYAASASASTFFARYPRSPYARRVRSIVGDTGSLPAE